MNGSENMLTAAANPHVALPRRRRHKRRSQQPAFQVAREIQQRLFPPSPRLVGFDIGGMSYPAEAAGGDFFDFLPMRDGGLGIVSGDVCGHGYGPALLMASARAYLRALARTHTDVSEILDIANHVLADDLGGRFITLILAKLDLISRSLVYASAGHTTGYILDAAGAVKARLESTGFPLGVFPGAKFPSSPNLSLQPRDLVLFLTDGIVEARAPDKTVFGTERALNIVRHYQSDPAAQIVTNLYHAVRAFAHNTPQADDITAVVLKVEAGT